jgi:hypothetical protein
VSGNFVLIIYNEVLRTMISFYLEGGGEFSSLGAALKFDPTL